MNKYTVENPGWHDKYETKILPLHFGQRLEDIGKISPVKILHMIGFIFRLCYILLTYRPSLVYFTIVPTGKIFYRDALFTLFIKMLGPRLVFHLHKKGIEEIVSASLFKRWLYRKTFSGVTTICLSEKLTADIRSVYSAKPFILKNGIDVVKDDIIKYDGAVPHLIYLSNLVKSKGIEIFLQSLADLHLQGYRFKARIVGAPVDYTLEQASAFCEAAGIAGSVDVVGARFGDEKFQELQSADIFVLPSFSECIPLSILEAMQFGLAVVATSVGGIPDIITHGQNGLLVVPGSVKDLTAKLKLLFTDKDLRTRLGDNGRDNFLQHYTLDHFYKGLTGIFDQVLSDSRKSVVVEPVAERVG